MIPKSALRALLYIKKPYHIPGGQRMMPESAWRGIICMRQYHTPGGQQMMPKSPLAEPYRTAQVYGFFLVSACWAFKATQLEV